MSSRLERFVSEAWRFLAVGLVASIVAAFLFNLLVHGFSRAGDAPLNGYPVTGYVLANLVGMLISFSGTKRWVFTERAARHADGGITAWTLINLGTMVIPISCLWLSRNALGLDDPASDNIAANVIGLGLGMAARFFLSRQLVFRRVTPEGDPADVSA